MKCAGCERLVREEWPRGMVALRCMGIGMRGIRGRVLAVNTAEYADNEERRTEAPAWCEKKSHGDAGNK